MEQFLCQWEDKRLQGSLFIVPLMLNSRTILVGLDLTQILAIKCLVKMNVQTFRLRITFWQKESQPLNLAPNTCLAILISSTLTNLTSDSKRIVLQSRLELRTNTHQLMTLKVNSFLIHQTWGYMMAI
jgi:hypothetical protein